MVDICINKRYISKELECINCFSKDEAVVVSELCVQDKNAGLELNVEFALCPGCLHEMEDEIFDIDNECPACYGEKETHCCGC